MCKKIHTAIASLALALPAIANAQDAAAGDLTSLGKAVEPANDPEKWVTRADLPAFALKNGIQGIVHYELDVDTDGKPTDCRITESSGSGILNVTTCDLVFARARFIPAESGAGFKIASTYSGKVRWEYPQKLRSRTSGNAVRISTQSRGDAELQPNIPIASYCQSIFKIGRLSPAEDLSLCQLFGTPDRVQKLIGDDTRVYRQYRIRFVHYSLEDINSDNADAKQIKQEIEREYAQRFIVQKTELEVTPQGKVVACKSLPSMRSRRGEQDPCEGYMLSDLPQFEPIDTSEGNRTVIQLYDVVMT